MASILVAGAGPVGLCCAIALARAGHAPVLVDARAHDAAADDPRAIALSHGSRLILERLGAWGRIEATPIRHIEVSQERGFGRTRIEAADHGIDALGHVARLGPLVRALLEHAQALGIEVRFDCAAGAATPLPHGIAVELATGSVEAALLVRAEGSPGPDATVKPYAQTAIVTEVASREPHQWRAWERFTREGPLALLPLDSGFSVVWCMQPGHAAVIAAQEDAAFLATLQQATRFAPYHWTHAAARRTYPLALARRRLEGQRREVWLGNAAQALHPVAGQGLNLGLRDAFELALELGEDIDAGALDAWRRRRRADRDAMVATTDRYVALFSNDLAPLRAARGLGLAAVDLIPPLRAFVARRMMFGVR